MLILVQVQRLSHSRRRFLFRLLIGVRIDIERGRYIGMTEKFLNLFDVHSLRQKQAACGMTQVVKANFRQAVLSGKPAGAGKRWSDTLSNRLSAISPNSAECTKTKPTEHGFSVLTPAQTVVQL